MARRLGCHTCNMNVWLKVVLQQRMDIRLIVFCFPVLQWAVSMYYRWYCTVLYVRFPEPQKSSARKKFALHSGFVKTGFTVMKQLM